MSARRCRELPLSEYALIGDGTTAALVATDGSIDWLCYGRFDGPAVFLRLLDCDRGGYLEVAPEGDFRSSQRYVGHTNVLATEFECDAGSMRITDAMPLDLDAGPVLLRKLEGLSGEVPVRLEFMPTFDFARASTEIELAPAGCTATGSGSTLRLSCPAPMTRRAGAATSSFRLGAGQTRWIVLTHGTPPLCDDAADRALKATLDEWERWSAQGRYPEPYADLLRRSALVLKLLIHAPTGAMVAAPTSSLPEVEGGVRNWDYRFTWLRDASWLVSALMDLGYHDESMAFIGWLESLGLEHRRAAVFYDLDGKPPSDEQELKHLRGYRRSRPVRVGNAAAGQDQHDVFGEVVAAIHMCSEAMPSMRPLRPGLWKLVTALADAAAKYWQHPDHGMWEARDKKRHFVSSKLFCWTALDRALAISNRDGLPGPIEKWHAARKRIRHAILTEGFDPELGFKRAFYQAEPDASGLILPRYGLLPADDPRVVRTMEVVRERLSPGGGLVRRYVARDGLPGTEGAFIACSFWLSDCLARLGRTDEASDIFEQTVAHANGVGLLSEQVDVETGALLGNYPQAFTHLALIRAAVAISDGKSATRPSSRRPSGRPHSQ